MHMADALLSPAVGLALDAGAGALLTGAARQLSRRPDYQRKVPLMGVLGAFVFAAQMVNFAIPGTGSSGHLAGGLLLSILLGPEAGLLVIASVLLVQAFFFADGGLLALGCNLFNMGLWPALLGLPLYRRLAGDRPGTLRLTLACLVPAVLAAELGAFGVMVETQLSGRADLPFSRFAALMLGIHLPIGVVEGLATAAMIRFAARMGALRPAPEGAAPERLPLAPTVLALAVFLGCAGAWFASTRPDGLEWSLARAGAALPTAPGRAHEVLRAVQRFTALMPDYALPGRRDAAAPPAKLDTSLAGALGLLATAGLVAGGAALSRRGRGPGRSAR
ncbi:MAG TPA: energy-coupling factor ABC transporter permease [Anaeromyxobacteraceae bacterium]|jgi:cobalt/nickel transport system permease protein|nr:energy-coupling factor ABC transporter permease [Anaeromyxobacteraceae bacterium]